MRSSKNARPGQNPARGRRRVGERPKPKRNVNAFANEILALIIHHQLDLKRGVGIHEGGKTGNDLTYGKIGTKTYPQDAAQLPCSSSSVFRLIQFGQGWLDTCEEIHAGIGQGYCPRGPHKQSSTDLALKTRDRSRSRRLRNIQLPPGCGKAALAGYSSEQSKSEQAVIHS